MVVKDSSMLMLFQYLAPLQNDRLVMSQCMQFTFEDKREVYLWLKKRVCKREKRASALGWNMDMQTLIRFALIQTEGAAYSTFMFACPYFILGLMLFFPSRPTG